MGIAQGPTYTLKSHSRPSSETVLSRSLVQNSGLTDIQGQVDFLVSNFVKEASEPRTLIALTAGSLAYRWGKIGVMGLGSSVIHRPLSVVVGLGAEVSAFEFTNRAALSLQVRAGLKPAPTALWDWSGPGGLQDGFLHSFLTFGILKGTGSLAREQNGIVRHAFQSTALVTGHQLAGTLGLAPKPEGPLAEQLLHAEVTNLQLEAGMGLMLRLAPGIHAWERNLDLNLRVGAKHPAPWTTGRNASPLIPQTAGVRGDVEIPYVLLMSTLPGKGDKGGGPKRIRSTPLLPIRSEEKNSELIRQAEHLEKTSQAFLDRLDPATRPELKEKLGGPLAPSEIFGKLHSFLDDHRSFIESLIREMKRRENRTHPDYENNLALLEAILSRIDGTRAISNSFQGETPNPEELKDFLTTLYRGANVLVGLAQPNTYDPIFVNEALDHYQEAFLDWHGYLHPERSYEIFQTPFGGSSGFGRPQKILSKDPETRNLIQILFSKRITPEHFAEAYSDLDSLSLEIHEGRLYLEGEKRNWDLGFEIARVEREFVFKGGAWNVRRLYEAVPPPADPYSTEPFRFRTPAWEPEEAKERLERELSFYDRLGVERILPLDIATALWNIPFASLQWFKKRLIDYVEVHKYEIPLQTLIHLKDPYQIAHLRDEKTQAPVGANFLRDLNVSWEGILSLPPYWRARERFEKYYAGKKAQEQWQQVEGILKKIKSEMSETSPDLKGVREELVALYGQLSRQMALRHRIDLGWGTFHHFSEHKILLESLRGRFRGKKEKTILRKEIEKGIGLLEKALRPLSPSGEAPISR